MENAKTIMLPFPAADPFLLAASDGCYYLYCTQQKDGFPVRSSRDLIHWEDRGTAFLMRDARWAVKCFWAPECYEFDGRFWLFYSADWKENPTGALENFRIGVAVSDRPEGPFADVSDRPIFDPGYPIIDANVYREGDRFFLYYSRCCYEHEIDGLEESWIYGVELKPDFSGVIGEPVLLLRPEQPWENRSAAETKRRWNEGSYVWKHDGRYYMTFSANHFGGPDYAVGYAVAEHPLGPYRKAEENPVLESGETITGTGHSCMFRDRDGALYICYHGRTKKTGMQRIGFISCADIDAQGRLTISSEPVDIP